MGYTASGSCLAKVGPDEPIFVLRAQDQLAPGIVREWATRAIDAGVKPEKVLEAYKMADAMTLWQGDHGAKVPD
jgi:hypothetical protein